MCWLIGGWQNATANEQLHEKWVKTNDTLYTGKGWVTIGHDTVFSENILLVQHVNQLLYIVTTVNQNNEQAVEFKLISTTNGKFVFENKQHDFPSRIVYINPTPDSLCAIIQGQQNGKYVQQLFAMIKLK